MSEAINAGKELRVERGVSDPQEAGNEATPVGKAAPIPRPRAKGRRRPSRQDLQAANQQVEIKAIDSESGAENDSDSPVSEPSENE